MDIYTEEMDGPKVISPRVFGDERGYFVESFQSDRYAEALGSQSFVQDNISRSDKGVLRGLHFQLTPHAQGKLVSVTQGAVLDVAVDVRPESPTFGASMTVELRAPERNVNGLWQWKQFWIPPGFAHGYVALEDDTIFSYKCTALYAPEHDAGVMWNDPEIAISWPDLGMDFIISEKDQAHPSLSELKEILPLKEVS